jgi:hypothetical protein
MSHLIEASPPGVLVPEGSLTWANGSLMRGKSRVMRPVWYYIPPPYDMSDAIPLSAPPHGAKNSDSVSPYATIQIIGQPRASVPRRVVKDLGWADIEILDGKTIHFTAKGLGTDVGTRISSPTKGMELFDSLDGGVPVRPTSGLQGSSRRATGSSGNGKGKGKGKLPKNRHEKSPAVLQGVRPSKAKVLI